MALGYGGSPNGSQPILLNVSYHHIRTNQEITEKPKDDTKVFKVTATIVAILTVVLGFTCTRVYINSGPDSSITGLVKTAIFTVFMVCNSFPMISSAETIIDLIWPKHQIGFGFKPEPNLQAIALVTIAFVSMLVGVCLLLILLL